MTIYPCGPKPTKKPKARKRLPRTKDSERASLVRACDYECRYQVKRLALGCCEHCGCRPSVDNPLDWAHGDGRAQVWALRYAHSGTFALCRDCHRAFEQDRSAFLEFRRSMVSDFAWAQIETLKQARPRVGIEELKLILVDLKRSVFRQGER